MQSSKILEMLDKGQLNELRELLMDEIYADSLKKTPNANKRYTAMKKYFSYTQHARECLQKPCPVEFEGREYTAFTNSWSLVLTSEPTGEIELFDKDQHVYPNVVKLLEFSGLKKKIDFAKVMAEAKSKGYKLKVSEVGAAFKYLMLYDDTYYKIGLIDISHRIIDDGEEAMTYHPYGERKPLTIQTSLGYAIVMPVHIKDKSEIEEDHIVIEVD